MTAISSITVKTSLVSINHHELIYLTCQVESEIILVVNWLC